MRLAALLSLLALLFGPLLSRPPLSAAQVEQFLSVAEDIRGQAERQAQPGSAGPDYFITAADALRIARGHGFDEAGWQDLARRVLTAYQFEQISALPANTPPSGRTLNQPAGFQHDPSLSLPERLAMQSVVSTTRGDLAALAAETSGDRQAILLYQDRLDRVVTP